KPVRATTLFPGRAPPHVVERLNHVMGGRTIHLHGGISPARAMQLVHARRPFASDADAAGDSDTAVHDEQFPVVAWDEPEPGAKAGRVEYRDRHTGPLQLLDELPGRAAGADPVEQQTDVYHALYRRNKSVREPLVDIIRPEDVTLQRDARLGAVDEIEHRVEGGRTVAKQRDLVPARHVGGGDSPETTGKRRTRDGGHIRTAPVRSEITSRECHVGPFYRMCARVGFGGHAGNIRDFWMAS